MTTKRRRRGETSAEDHMIKFDFRGKSYSLYLSGLGLYECYDHFGGDKSLIELIEGEGKETYQAAIWMLCEFSKQGELYRRYMGEEPEEYLKLGQVMALAQPWEYPEIKTAVTMTIYEGFKREHPGQEDTDPWLAEFEAEKSKKKEAAGRSISGLLRGPWGWGSRRG